MKNVRWSICTPLIEISALVEGFKDEQQGVSISSPLPHPSQLQCASIAAEARVGNSGRGAPMTTEDRLLLEREYWDVVDGGAEECVVSTII